MDNKQSAHLKNKTTVPQHFLRTLSENQKHLKQQLRKENFMLK
jgi:hypothetical protein